jgi:cytochrome c553
MKNIKRQFLSFQIFLFFSLALMNFSFAKGDFDNGAKLFQNCISCHGASGEGNPEQKAPRLRGQHSWYIVTQLENFKSGARKNPAMEPFIKNLSATDLEDLGVYLEKLPTKK